MAITHRYRGSIVVGVIGLFILTGAALPVSGGVPGSAEWPPPKRAKADTTKPSDTSVADTATVDADAGKDGMADGDDALEPQGEVETTREGDGWQKRIKNIPISKDGNVTLSIGGSLRGRMEYFNNFGFVDGSEEVYFLWRALVDAELKVGDNLSGLVEFKHADMTDRDLPGGRRTVDVDTAALERAHIDFRITLGDNASVKIRGGRQYLDFGAQRLVSHLPWANTQRRWDGVRLDIDVFGWTVSPFWTLFVPVKKYDFNTADWDRQFYGVYATKGVNESVSIDLYFLGAHNDAAFFNGTTADEERYTVGARFFGRIADTAIGYDVEGAYQFGDFGGVDISAYFIAAELSATLGEAMPGQMTLHLGADFASGDDPSTGDLETFNQLFPLGHKYLGYIDVIGRQNIIDVWAGASVKPHHQLVVAVNVHSFWKADQGDLLYNAGGASVAAGAGATDSFVGIEVDLTVKWMINPNASVLIGYSHFFRGDLIDSVAGTGDIDFVYVQALYTF